MASTRSFNYMRPLHEADRRTREKLSPTPGERRRIGDREAGIWVCPESGWWQIADSGAGMFLSKGSRLRSSWEFRGDGWWLAQVSLDTVIPPPVSRWRRFLRWFVAALRGQKVE